jgi:acetylornithine deacetylase/succinyl-diaminopimelate desuccinylase-like protein
MKLQMADMADGRWQIRDLRLRIGDLRLQAVAVRLGVFILLMGASLLAQAPFDSAQGRQPDWKALEGEIMRHYQAVLRIDTTNPPGNEHLAVEYLKQVFDTEGIPAQVFALDSNRSNIVARLKGSGKRRPLLIMAHTDDVTVDASKWKFPPFSATRDGGYVYARGAIDDKDNLTAGLMTMVMLKRMGVPLDRDVIFLAESGEEGNSNFGIQFMVAQHFAEIDAEYCFAEGGGVTRIGGEPRFATVQATEKIPRGIDLVSHGISGHGSIPLKSNAIVHLAGAIAKVAEWRPEVRFNETTGTYFRGLASIAAPENAKYYRDVLSTDPRLRAAADDWLVEHEPQHASMLRTSVSPNIFTGGYRSNVIPSEARATLDVRMLPDEDPAAFLAAVNRVIDDPAVEARFPAQNTRPAGAAARLDSEPFKAIEAANTRIYSVPTLPTMSTFATDMAQLRAKGMQCYGIGPAVDLEDGPKGFGMHSDQERLLESELYRFVRFNYEVIEDLARAK